MDTPAAHPVEALRDQSSKPFPAFCYAPFVSVYFHPVGDVYACCRNTEHRLGSVMSSTLREIWDGQEARTLRRALQENRTDLGCSYCAWQASTNGFQSTLASSYDAFEVSETDPSWPKVMEFGLSNTCNLECVMCNGDLSSRIRSRREGRPPLRSPYTESFFAELSAFLPHLEVAKFYGGEPFLARESLLVMESMAKAGVRAECLVTTNGTIWNDQVERIVNSLDMSIALSIDALHDEALTRIRVGVDPQDLRENLERFRMATANNGSSMVLNYCFMQQNWMEFEPLLRFADERGLRVFVNTVTNVGFSPYCMITEDFDQMLDALECRDADARAALTINRDVWVRQLEDLRRWRDTVSRRDPQSVSVPNRKPDGRRPVEASFVPRSLSVAIGTNVNVGADTGSLEERALALATQDMPDAAVSMLRCDDHDVVLSVRTTVAGIVSDTYVNVEGRDCVGRSYTDVMGLATRPYGGLVRTTRDEVIDGLTVREVIIGRTNNGSGDGRLYARACSYPCHEAGEYRGSATVVAWATTKPAWAVSTSSPRDLTT